MTTPATPQGSTRTRLVGLAAVLVLVVVLRMSRDVTLPIVGGLLVAAMVWPVLRRLERLMPRALALLCTVLFVVAIVLALFAGIGWTGARMGERILERRDRLETLHQRLNASVEQFGVQLPPLPVPGSEGAGGGRGGGTTPEAGAGSGGAARQAAVTLFSGLSGLALAIAFMALALAEARDVGDRVRRRFPRERADRIIRIAGEVAHTVQRFVVVKSITSAITGAATLLITLAFGVDFAVVWGMLAFLLEYVPTVGSVLAVIPPVLYAAIQFDSLTRPLTLLAVLTVTQLTLGNYVDPKIEGRLLSVSPFVVLASIVLWAWVWGAPGALLGVPLTIAITTTARHFDASRWIWAVLTEPEEEEEGKEE